MQRAVNLTINGVVVAMEVSTDDEERILRSAGKRLSERIAFYSGKFKNLPMQEILVRVALEMAFSALRDEEELCKIREDCKDMLNF